jgi:hypothetical protein
MALRIFNVGFAKVVMIYVCFHDCSFVAIGLVVSLS